MQNCVGFVLFTLYCADSTYLFDSENPVEHRNAYFKVGLDMVVDLYEKSEGIVGYMPWTYGGSWRPTDSRNQVGSSKHLSHPLLIRTRSLTRSGLAIHLVSQRLSRDLCILTVGADEAPGWSFLGLPAVEHSHLTIE